ncbi:MAG TPA: hypothetical protein VM529_13725, partial [Gemmata sp.]|nr:hypothetical protein [Gemmata sp.]
MLRSDAGLLRRIAVWHRTDLACRTRHAGDAAEGDAQVEGDAEGERTDRGRGQPVATRAAPCGPRRADERTAAELIRGQKLVRNRSEFQSEHRPVVFFHNPRQSALPPALAWIRIGVG